jgi:hypothetical protein
MIECPKCENHYDENANKICPYCTHEITGDPLKPTPKVSGDKTEVWNGENKNNHNKIAETEEVKPTPIIEEKDKNMRIEEKINKQNADATVMITKDVNGSDTQPLVAWFVVVEGKGKGRDIRIIAGQNSIGRDKSNMVCIDFGDTTISREKHAFIIYDTKHKKFMFKSGEGQNISYLNEEGVYSPMPIKDGDTIEIGETKLRFVQLCDENFEW